MSLASGFRVLVVEDEELITLLIEDILTDIGCEIVGPVGNVPDALKLAQSADIGGALLDLNLAGHDVYPVADALAHRGIPFVFTTGYDHSRIAERFSDVPTLSKPFGAQMVEDAVVKELFGRSQLR
jgi:CheY-like chemotaxis protein